MFNGARAERLDRERTVEVSRYTPKISAMTDIFVPRMEIFPTGRSRKIIEARVPAIRMETRPEAAQERLHEKERRARQERAVRQRARIERISADARRVREKQMYVDYVEREEQEFEAKIKAVLAALGVLAATGAIGAAILEGQTILASLVTSLESFGSLLLGVGFETLRGALLMIASGDPTFIAASALVGLSLLYAFHKAMMSGAYAKAEREEYGF